MILPEATPGVAFGTAADGDPRTDAGRRRALSAQLGITAEWAWVRQVHGAAVVVATAPGVGPGADGLVTTDPAVPIAVSVADCYPVALLGPGAAGLAHAGWRGAAAGVVREVARVMDGLGAPPQRAVVGPGIGPCCFEVGPEVSARFPNHAATTRWGTPSVDLTGSIGEQLDGIPVETVGGCTHHDDRFQSYRRDRTRSRQFAVAWLAPG